MEEYHEYLAAHVLNDKEIVTYRTLSRALKVHVNLAKQMLWDFHNQQNIKKPGSVHATYLLSGIRSERPSKEKKKKAKQAKDDEDITMDSSPPELHSSAPKREELEEEHVPVTMLMLARQEHLEKAKVSFVELSGIHMYSVESDGLSDFQALTECTRKIYMTLSTEDPLITGAQYGTIRNNGVRRRTRPTHLPLSTTSKVIAEAKKDTKVVAASTKESMTDDKANAQQPKAGPQRSTTTGKPATLKKQSSSILASFAKGSSKPKAAKKEEPKKTADEDTPMANISDDDPEDDASEADIAVKVPTGKSKQDRQAELEAMMDVDDESEPAEPMEEEEEGEEEEDIEPPAGEIPAEPVKEETQAHVVVENGRRRGRRRVTKKRTVKDEDGYLVTKEEAVWESFSEDEPAPKKAKTTAASQPASTVKKGGKPGQGNIMSFFGKK